MEATATPTRVKMEGAVRRTWPAVTIACAPLGSAGSTVKSTLQVEETAVFGILLRRLVTNWLPRPCDPLLSGHIHFCRLDDRNFGI